MSAKCPDYDEKVRRATHIVAAAAREQLKLKGYFMNQHTDEMREAFEKIMAEPLTPEDDHLSIEYNFVKSVWRASTTRYEDALRDISELIGLAKNTGSETYLEKALTTITNLLGKPL